MSCNQLKQYVTFAETNVKNLTKSKIDTVQIMKNKSIFTYQICYVNMEMKEKKCRTN